MASAGLSQGAQGVGNCQGFGEGEEEGKQEMFSRSGAVQTKKPTPCINCITKREYTLRSPEQVQGANSRELETAGHPLLGANLYSRGIGRS